MFAYCNNNPSNLLDPAGKAAYAREDITFVGGAGVIDLLWPITYLLNAITARPNVDENEKELVIATTKTADPNDKAIFTPNPYDFNPNGLKMHVCVDPGTGSNGGIIKWEIPGTKIAVFEWNEDWEYGAHYHTMKVEWKNKHYGPHHPIGAEVPEPWQSKYF